MLTPFLVGISDSLFLKILPDFKSLRLELAASLLDAQGKPTKSELHLEVWYAGPGQHENLGQHQGDLERGIAREDSGEREDEEIEEDR